MNTSTRIHDIIISRIFNPGDVVLASFLTHSTGRNHIVTDGRTNERTDDTSHGIVTDRNVLPAFHVAFSVVCGRIGPLASERNYVGTSTPVASIVSTPQYKHCGARHEGKQALPENNLNITGEEFANKWFCNAGACQSERVRKRK